MKSVILLSIVIFACLTFSINREKLTNRYKMIMIKNRGLRSTVNKTLEKLESLCGRYDACVKYVRKINDVKATPRTPTADANICCQLDTPLCKACHEGISVDEYLKKYEAHSPKITMLIVNDMKHKEKYDINTKNLKEYAKRNHYSFVEKTSDSEHRCNHVKNFFFKKHCIVYHYMTDSKKKGEWIFVLDGDNAVRNPNTKIRLESFVKNEKDIIYYYRFHNNEIAAGNYAIKNTQWSQDYLKGYYELHDTYKGFNADNGALHYYLLPDKKRCDKFYRNPSSSVTLYDKYVGCVHKELQAANFPLEEHIFVYKHGKAWTYDGWVVDNKWSKDTLMHHAIKKPQNKNTYTDEKELKSLLKKRLIRERKKRPHTGWEYTKDAWNVGKKIVRQNVVLVPMVYDHLKLFNEGLRKQIKDAISVIYISGIGHKECPVIDNHYVQCEKEYKLKAVGLNILFKYVAKKYPKNTLVTIMDADDTFSPCTLKQIEMFYAKHNPKVLFHSLSRTDIDDQKCKDPQLTHDGVYLYDYAKKTEGQRLHLFDHAHHGHITMDISVALDINHKAIPRAGTDTHFMRDVIKKYGRKKDTIMFTEDIYTIYKRSNDAWMKTVKHMRKIMIGIPMKNRRGYVKFHAKILTQYNKINSKDIFIFDDFSDQYGEEELRNWYGKDIHYFRSEKALGADGNTRLLFEEFLKSEYDILLTLDSDLLMKNNWKEFIHDNIDESGVISLYHSKASHHKTTDCNGVRCRKHSMGNAAAVMTKDIVKKMLKEHNNYENFDWGWVEYFKKHEIHMYVPQNSIVMHYGKVGQNNDCKNVLEVAKNFDRTDLPAWIKSGLEYYFDKCSDPSTSYIKTKELSIDETFDMLESGHSISRFGDGEITLMQGTSIRFQKHTPLLQKKLLEIKNDKNFCIGIVPILHGIPSYFQKHTRQFFTQYIPKYRKIFTEDSYCNAFISRKDNVNGYSRKYFEEKWNKVFDNKNVLVIHSSEISTTDSSVFKRHLKSAKSVTYMSDNIPKVNAFSSYDTIMKNAIQQIDKNNIDITVISLGPTATVMAYDLYKQGYTALDVGQFSGDYSPIDENREGNQNAKKKKLLFIIPFRDRHKHFVSFKQHVKRLTSKFAVDVYVIEQANNDYFNRAWLLNIGLKEAKLRNVVYDCVVTSDVDMFGDVDYSWCDRPTHICSELSCHGNSVPYASYSGGVVTAKLSDWETINGYTNEGRGWGGEDDDLFHRFRQAKLLTGKTLRRPAKGEGKCDCLHDEGHTKRVRHKSSYANIKKKIDRMSRDSKEWKTDGLNSLEYNLISVKQMNDDGFSVIWYEATSMDNVFEVGIKTMNRYEKTIQQVKSIRKLYPSTRIYIVDDGKEDHSDKYKNEKSVVYKKMPFDSGLSAGRNLLVTSMTSDYVVIMDDDMIWKKEFDVEHGIEILKNTNKKVLTGGTTDRSMYSGTIHKEKDAFHICPTSKKNKQYPECVETDIGLNIMIANRLFLEKNKWDESLKLGEHEKFFLSLKQNNPNNVLACKSLTVKHNNVGWDKNKEYVKLRLRAEKEYKLKAVGKVKEHSTFDTECQQLVKRKRECENFGLGNYKRNTSPKYDLDTPTREDLFYQFDVYNTAASIARQYNKKWIIDMGCGSGNKLKKLYDWGFNVVGIDFKFNLENTKKKFVDASTERVKFFEVNLATDVPPIPVSILTNAVLVSADVIEHVVNPDNFIEIIKELRSKGLKAAVISTPDSSKTGHSQHTPARPSDVQIWNSKSFETYLGCKGLSFTMGARQENYSDKTITGIKVVIPKMEVHMRDFFAKKPICAIVFNSGVLLKTEHGDKIDQYENVYRFNMLPTDGFEKHVGSKTTHDIIWSDYFDKYSKSGKNTKAISFAWNNKEIEMYEKFKRKGWIMLDHSWIDECNTMLGFNETGQWCSSGMATILYLHSRCSQMKIFGLDHDPCYPYHYNEEKPEECTVVQNDPNKHHDFAKEHLFIKSRYESYV